ncbi:MAG: hypothetical protein DIU62_001070 [Pseudomonadota bacterium]|nr:MAG: hypothetical protein DIU62_09370 [Pseudomonadota bacterium]
MALAGCGSVQVRPEPVLPEPLIAPMPARVALVLDDELRSYVHEETRGGTNWKVELGPGHERMFRDVFRSSFSELAEFGSGAQARGADVQVVFRPRIEQFSFASAEETGGEYWAVTIRYVIALTSTAGEPVDNLSLTGYGSSRGGRAGNALTRATLAAMRDAAAKFLVQMPRLPVGRKLAAGEVLTGADASTPRDVVEAVPVEPEEEPGDTP